MRRLKESLSSGESLSSEMSHYKKNIIIYLSFYCQFTLNVYETCSGKVVKLAKSCLITFS